MAKKTSKSAAAKKPPAKPEGKKQSPLAKIKQAPVGRGAKKVERF